MLLSIELASDDSLRKVLRSMSRHPPTETNCWWLSYRLAPVFKGLVRDELKLRRNRHQQQAKQIEAQS